MALHEPVAMKPAKARGNGWGILLYKRPIRHRYSHFFSFSDDDFSSLIYDTRSQLFSPLTSLCSGPRPLRIGRLRWSVGLETQGNPRLWVRIPAPTGSPRLLPGCCTVGCSLLQVCTLGWVKCREHISLLIILCIIVYVTNKAHPSLICIVVLLSTLKPLQQPWSHWSLQPSGEY